MFNRMGAITNMLAAAAVLTLAIVASAFIPHAEAQ